jgi:hypothetical protein
MRNSPDRFPFGAAIARYSDARKWMRSPASRQSITDLTAGTGRFNLVGGTVTMLMGIASAISVATSGFIFHAAGHLLAFMIFAGIAGMATALAWFLLPETKPAQYAD